MNYWKIDTEDVCNGDGLRVVLWLSGCNHQCYNCQNPQTWDPNSGILFDKSAKERIFRELNKEYISGLTLSGGDPLYELNLDGVLDLITEINKRYKMSKNKTIWLYTGYEWEQLFNDKTHFVAGCSEWKRREIVKKCDVLVDGKFIKELKNTNLIFRGSSNQRIIDINKTKEKGKIVIWER